MSEVNRNQETADGKAVSDKVECLVECDCHGIPAPGYACGYHKANDTCGAPQEMECKFKAPNTSVTGGAESKR